MKAAGRERDIFVCGKNTTLMSLLAEFKRRPHLAVVSDSEENGEVTDNSHHIGIVTLHNVFAAILETPHQELPIDNHDDSAKDCFVEHGKDSAEGAKALAGTVRLFDRRLPFAVGAGGPASEQPAKLGKNEARAVCTYLSATQPVFSKEHIAEEDLLKLLAEATLDRPRQKSLVYKHMEKATFGLLVLQGAIRVSIGVEELESTVGPWSCIGMRSLEPPTALLHALKHGASEGEELLENHDAHDYIPDFTASVLTDNSMLLKITRSAYLKAYHSTQVRLLHNPSARNAARP